ncbi:hypothetical protein SH668x_000303 [Planctomicrobium sp. SH668]|uniref:hypothetical protein n=1 Tax=Planctomicrobium sp. SH668 TaxID=3448126 RepID=UPI003F5BC99B
MVDQEEIERIRFRMRRVRRHLNDDVERLHSDTAQLFDWKYYVARHPVASIGAIVALGYMLVPSKSKATEEKVYLDPDVSRAYLEHAPEPVVESTEQKATQGIFLSLGAFALNALVKAGLNYASQQVRSTFLNDFQSTKPSSGN